ncbi:ABC transporter permease subunit, partial [Albidovulum sp.]
MAIVSDAPKGGFRPSMLIYDTRYRSMTIQIAVLVMVMAGAAWLVDNTVRNLQTLGKDFSFGFLWARAGYDINQTLIPYTNDSTHGRALFVGLINTILVSVMGCVAATVIGVLVGILRLSRNWLVARIMTGYVETFRNVPLLLWIFVIYAIFTEI